MVIRQGQIWWADLGEPIGSAPGFFRPVVILQANWVSDSRVNTVTCVPLSSNSRLAKLPGSTEIVGEHTGLTKTSYANANQVSTIDQRQFEEHIGHVTEAQLKAIFAGIDFVWGRRKK